MKSKEGSALEIREQTLYASCVLFNFFIMTYHTVSVESFDPPIQLNKQIRDMWLDALVSGVYSQCTGLLHDPDDAGFCCLGVLCDIHVRNAPVRKRYKWIPDWRSSGATYGGCDQLPPERVREYAYIDAYDIRVLRFQSILAEMNDDGFTFDDIAAYIEKNTIGVEVTYE